MALRNPNEEIKRLQTFGDKIADRDTALSGSGGFLLLNILIFVGWLLVNTGQFGAHLIFDEYPFGFLTLAVSLEAIILAIFVLISQNRQSERSEIRTELDYRTDLRSEADLRVLATILERIAKHQNIDVSDLLSQLKEDSKKIMAEHQIHRK
jgi:CRP/FNR family cyclic AMP-dependent transcriptional regulator